MKSFKRQSLYRTLVFASSLAAAAAFSVTAMAQAKDYPARDITFIVPFNPGGVTDPIARQFTSQLAKILGTTVNVENKPGGSATIGTGVVVRSKPDGYTIGLGTNNSLVFQPLVNTGLPYKTPDDYQSIVKLGDSHTVLSVRADAPWKTFDEFMEDVKKQPGKIRVSVSGLQSSGDMTIQELNMVAGVKITTVPFTGGGGEAMLALLGGRVEALAGHGVSTLGQERAGKVRVLAVFKKGKYDLFPNSVSTADAGYDATLPSGFYVVAPKGIPQDVQEKLLAASLQVVRSEEFIDFTRANGYTAEALGGDDMKAELVHQSKIFADLIKFMGLK
jgi:tripartite-type tricarboxylate transporter receptor subunit TctC